MKKNIRLGISIYPHKSTINECKEYIEQASNHGFTRIFSSLLRLKNDSFDKDLEKYSTIFKYALNKGFEVIADVNPIVYERLGARIGDLEFIKQFGLTGIRLDESFGGHEEMILTNNSFNMMIELNASSSLKDIKYIVKNGGNPSNLIACHNFYPLKFTGLSIERFTHLSTIYNELGIKVAAFVTPDDTNKIISASSIHQGAPTLERHRNMPLREQTLELLNTHLISDIIISLQGATDSDMQEIKNALQDFEKINSLDEINLNMHFNENFQGSVEEDILFINNGKKHVNRLDATSYFLRSAMPRIYYKNKQIKPNNTKNKLKIGDIIIVNETLKRYKGELHIIIKDIDDTDTSKNVVGSIKKSDLFKLQLVNPGQKFILHKI